MIGLYHRLWETQKGIKFNIFYLVIYVRWFWVFIYLFILFLIFFYGLITLLLWRDFENKIKKYQYLKIWYPKIIFDFKVYKNSIRKLFFEKKISL